MAERGQGEVGGEGGSGAEGRCPVSMHDNQPCGRPLHHAPPGVDREPVCLMHSRDPEKSDAQFQEEFERILREAGDGLADFTGFVFPTSNYCDRLFTVECDFSDAEFTQKANFSVAEFTQKAYFVGTTFTHGADFGSAEFTQEADFSEATFMQKASFRVTTFTQKASFLAATFTQEADFSDATFTQKASFLAATFTQEADFSDATFTRDADFRETTFAGIVDFRGTHFAEIAQFVQTKFRRDPPGHDNEPGPIFANAKFEKLKNAIFYQTYFGQALFHNCDVSEMKFSDVIWRKRDNGKWMVFDEIVDLEYFGTEALQPPKGNPNPRNYRLVAELYQQLKKNYDDRRDYWTAGDFHYGEMEMKRLASDHHNKAVRWLHSNLGLVAWYKYASEYGESYVRPALWLGLVLLVFMLLYPVTGLQMDAGGSGASTQASAQNAKESSARLTYWHPWQSGGDTGSGWRARRDLVGHSLVTTLYVAAFQKDLTYQPSYPWGRLLALAEVLLTSTLGALFLLAVRRQFKR